MKFTIGFLLFLVMLMGSANQLLAQEFSHVVRPGFDGGSGVAVYSSSPQKNFAYALVIDEYCSRKKENGQHCIQPFNYWNLAQYPTPLFIQKPASEDNFFFDFRSSGPFVKGDTATLFLEVYEKNIGMIGDNTVDQWVHGINLVGDQSILSKKIPIYTPGDAKFTFEAFQIRPDTFALFCKMYGQGDDKSIVYTLDRDFNKIDSLLTKDAEYIQTIHVQQLGNDILHLHVGSNGDFFASLRDSKWKLLKTRKLQLPFLFPFEYPEKGLYLYYDEDTSNGTLNSYVSYLDSSLDIQWTTKINQDPLNNIDFIHSGIVDPQGNLYIAGEDDYFYDKYKLSGYGETAFIHKISPTGQLLWSKHILDSFNEGMLELTGLALHKNMVVGTGYQERYTFTQFPTLRKYIWLFGIDTSGCWNGQCGEEIFVKGIPKAVSSPLPFQNASIKAFPNPVTDLLQLQGHPPGALYRVFDLLGRPRLQGILADDADAIDCQALHAGTYTIEIFLPDNPQSWRSQFLKL